jgi:hypothetical protein
MKQEPTEAIPGASPQDAVGIRGLQAGEDVNANGFCTPFPFGARRAEVELMSADHGVAGRRWCPTLLGTRDDLEDCYQARVRRDILYRLQVITDPVTQREIISFWLGHDLPELAELGLAAVQVLSPDGVCR